MIKKKSNYLILFGLLFSIFIIPNNVFAEPTNNRACDWNSFSCIDEVDITGLGEMVTRVDNLSYLNLKIGADTYKAYFFYGYNDVEVMNSKFDISNLGLHKVVPEDDSKFTEDYLKNLYSIYFKNGGSSFLQYDEIVSKLPYFTLYKADKAAQYVITFSYSDKIMLRLSGDSTRVEQRIPLSSDLPNKLGSLTFFSNYLNKEDKIIIFNLSVNLPSDPMYQYDDMFFTISDSTDQFTLNGVPYYQTIEFSRYFDSSKYLNGFDSLLNNDNFFTSNSNLFDSSGNNLDYLNKQDISNSGGNNGNGFEVPSDLGDILDMIPKMLADMVSAFSVVGTIFTTAMFSFPPIITVGLYSVFILGILILIIKCLK